METADPGCVWIHVRLAPELVGVCLPVFVCKRSVDVFIVYSERSAWRVVDQPGSTPFFVNVNVTFSNCFSFAAIITALLIT